MRNELFVGAVGLLLCGLSFEAHAVCETALVLDNNRSSSSNKSDVRLATLVTQSTYEELKHDGGLGATIYGVPVSANYGDYHTAATNAASSLGSSIQSEEATNLEWSGLGINGLTAYRACLDQELFARDGLRAAVVGATTTQIALKIRWFSPGLGTATLTWSPNSSVGGVPLPATIAQGDQTLILPRPSMETLIAANFNGFSTGSIDLTPLPPPIPPLPSITGTCQPSGQPVEWTFQNFTRGPGGSGSTSFQTIQVNVNEADNPPSVVRLSPASDATCRILVGDGFKISHLSAALVMTDIFTEGSPPLSTSAIAGNVALSPRLVDARNAELRISALSTSLRGIVNLRFTVQYQVDH